MEDESCCPEFDPSAYADDDGKNGGCKRIAWNEKPFVRDGTWCFLYVPLAFGRATARASKRIVDAGAQMPAEEETMVLSECVSPWYSDVFVSSSKKEVEGAEVEKISGTFAAKVFEGDYSNTGKWVDEMKGAVKDKIKKMYFYYPTCPKCAMKYGKNYVVILAKTD